MGKPAATDRPCLPSLRHSFTLDAIVHCRTETEAQEVRRAMAVRMQEGRLELHPAKTQIVSCQEDARRGTYLNERCDCLG
jgi:RNA-directed DNA polymerase